MTLEDTTEDTAKVIADVEAHRTTTAEKKLEGNLSIFDWMQRIKSAAQHAGSLTRQDNAQLEYDAWIELAAIVVGRAEQVLDHITRSECHHLWPDRPGHVELHDACVECGTLYGEVEQ